MKHINGFVINLILTRGDPFLPLLPRSLYTFSVYSILTSIFKIVPRRQDGDGGEKEWPSGNSGKGFVSRFDLITFRLVGKSTCLCHFIIIIIVVVVFVVVVVVLVVVTVDVIILLLRPVRREDFAGSLWLDEMRYVSAFPELFSCQRSSL